MQVNKFFSLNVNSIVNNNKRVLLIDLIKQHSPFVTFLSETCLKSNHRIRIKNLKTYRDDNFRGTAIILPENVRSERINFTSTSFSITLVKVTLNDNHNNHFSLLLASIYIPNIPASNVTQDLERLYQLSGSFDLVLMGGDFNARHTYWNDKTINSNGRMLYNWFMNDPFLNWELIAPSSPTYPRSGSFIDLFFVSVSWHNLFKQNLSPVCYTTPSISDHFGICLEFELNSLNPELVAPQIFQNFKNMNWKKWSNELNQKITDINIPEDRNLNEKEIDEYINSLTSVITVTTNSYAKSTLRSRDPYKCLSHLTRKMIALRKAWSINLKRLYHKYYNAVNKEYKEVESRIRCLNILIKDRVKLELDRNFRRRLALIKPTHDAWKEIDRISGRKRLKANVNSKEIFYEGRKLENVEDKLSAFHRFYNKVYERKNPLYNVDLNSKVNNTIRNFLNNEYGANLITFTPETSAIAPSDMECFCSCDEITIYRKALNTKKSAGLDKITNFILKKCPVSLDSALAIIFNNCINLGYFPNPWKKVKLIPISKKESVKNIEDFRPISLLSNLSKLLERIIAYRLDEFCIDKDLIPWNQFGFKCKHSTENALLKLSDTVVKNLRNKTCTVALDLDLEKAFDTVWSDGIVYKLIQAECPLPLTRILLSFLKDRELVIQVNNSLSEPVKVCSGVPQGSVLGPKLFNIFLSDFPINSDSINEVQALLYADDTLILANGERPFEALNKINNVLPKLESYYLSWGFKLNPNKSGLICFRNASGKGHHLAVRESKQLSLKMFGRNIPKKSQLGI